MGHAADGEAVATRPSQLLRLLVVDDHEVVREGLAAALGKDPRFEVVGEAADASEAMQCARRTLPDVAIVDMHMPNVPGDELCVKLRALLPSSNVVILSSYLSEEEVAKAIRAGAGAYVTKAAGLPELRNVLGRLYEHLDEPPDVGRVPQIVKYLEGLIQERSDESAPTPQQRRVLELAAEGLTYREIADRLMISESTVRFHIQKLKVKLSTSSRTELIVQAIRRGFIAPRQDEAVRGSAG